MATPINCPQVGQDIETAILLEWRVKEGDEIQKGDVIAEVESDKATFEVEAFVTGTVVELLYEEGDELQVLQPIAYVGRPGEERIFGKEESAGNGAGKPAGSTKPGNSRVQPKSTPAPGEWVFASPSARRIARKYDIDVSTIEGSGPKGRVIKRDIMAVVESGAPAVKEKTARQPKISQPRTVPSTEVESARTEDTEIPYTKMRQRIAEQLVKSKQTVPHFYLFIDVDMTDTVAWRERFNEQSQRNITYNDILVEAVARNLRTYAKLNAHADDEKLIVRKDINIGVAVSVEDGLLVPVIPNADRKNLQEISENSRENAAGARKGSLKNQAPGTFTISNLGRYQVNRFLPIINPPEVAILGVGSMEKRVVPHGQSSIGVRDMLTLSLACDHRAVDGAYASVFLESLKQTLEQYGG